MVASKKVVNGLGTPICIGSIEFIANIYAIKSHTGVLYFVEKLEIK